MNTTPENSPHHSTLNSQLPTIPSLSSFQLSSFNVQVAFFLLLLITVIGIRLHLSAMPLERDEGEYAYTAQLLLKGSAPFTGAYTMKFPGTHLAYAGILSIFGQTDSGIRIGLLLINLITAWFTYKIGSELKDRSTGFWAAGAFLIYSLSTRLLGVTANCEHFVLLPVAIGSWFLFRTTKTVIDPQQGKLLPFLSGLFFGLAVTMKQQGIFFVLFSLTYLGYQDLNSLKKSSDTALRKGLWHLVGLMIAPAAMVVWLLSAGSYDLFYFWCIEYAQYYGSMWSVAEAWNHFSFNFLPLARDHLLMLICTFWGLVQLWRHQAQAFWFITFMGVGAMLAVIPGWNFRPHYFLYLSLPFSLGIGCFAARHSATAGLVGLALLLPLWMQRAPLFQTSPDHAVRILYPHSPFKETKELAQWLSTVTKFEDKIGILGSEPQINFYSGRVSATPYIYMYPLMEPQPFAIKMQTDFMALLEKDPPKYLVHVRVPSSWSPYPHSKMKLLEWIPQYLSWNYKKAREISVPAFREAPERQILVYERK